MKRIERLDPRSNQGGRIGLNLIAEAKRLACQFQDDPGCRSTVCIGSAIDLELQRLGGNQLQLSSFDQAQNRQHGFRFEIDAQLGSIIQRPLQTASIEVNAHSQIIHWRPSSAIQTRSYEHACLNPLTVL